MKVGDYVRTKRGQIHKITDLKGYYENNELIEDRQYVHIDNHFSGWDLGQFQELIVKSSPNIIDLIEENDLIEIEYKISTGDNQKEIVQVIKNVNNELFIKTYTEHYVFIEDIEKTIYKIKGIITHEQIKSMEYKVKE